MSELSKKFITEDEIDEKKKKRQEEWEKVRRPDQPEDAPEEQYDPRTLFERLEEQKAKKQEEHDEAHKLKNQIRGLDEDETEFLDYVSNRRQELLDSQKNEDEEVLNEYRNAVVANDTEKSKQTVIKVADKKTVKSGGASQIKLLAGALKRKSSNEPSTSDEKKSKNSRMSDESSKSDDGEKSNGDLTNSNTDESNNGKTQIIGLLPGLAAYTEDSEEETTDSASDSDIDTDTFKKIIHVHCSGASQ